MTDTDPHSLSRKIWEYLPWLVLLLLLLCITVLFVAIQSKTEKANSLNKDEKSEITAVNIVTQIVEPVTMRDRLNLPATVHAWEDVMIKAEIRGRITKMHAEEGDRVAEGDLVAEIDEREYRNNLEALQARYELAQTNYNRLKKLSGSDAVARSQFDEARSALAELKASLATARLNLERSDIKAPMAGIINFIPAGVGDVVAFGDPVAQLLKIDPLKVDVAIPEVDAPLVRKIPGCTIEINALGNQAFYAEKIFFSSQPQMPAMVYILRLKLQNPGDLILPGMFARGKIVKQTIADTLAVPLYAVIARDEKKFVYVVEGDTAAKKMVTTGILEDWKVQITSGLAPGDEVVVAGHRGIEEGQQVNVIKQLRDPDNLHRQTEDTPEYNENDREMAKERQGM